MKKKVHYILLLSLLFSCSTKQSHQTMHNKDFEVPDSLFALKNLSNTNILGSVYTKQTGFFLYSVSKVKFTMLNSVFNQKITYPILVKDHGFRKDYLDSYESSYFISKQQKVGNYQPITIWTEGLDNCCLLLVVVDSTFKPISHTILKGNYGCALKQINKNVDCVTEYTYSTLKRNKIISCRITTYFNIDKEVYKDSIVYRSEIQKDGLIKTQKTDSVRLIP